MLRWATILLIAVCPAVVFASSGSITGRVTDPSGAVIAGVSLTLRNVDTSFSRTAVSDARGAYAFSALPPARYELAAELPGYGRTIWPVTLEVDQTVIVDLGMRIAPRQDSVTAQASVTSEAASWGAVVRSSELGALPLNEHNFLSFALLAPGAVMGADGSQLSCQGGGMSVSGAREQANTFLIDGFDNNDASVRQYSALAPMAAVDQFKLQSSGSDAEFGANAGAQVNVVLKSGQNGFHGTLFDYARNRHLDARNYFDLPDCSTAQAGAACGEIPRLDRQQFGGTLGGAIRRDRTFFFLAYEGSRLQQATTRTATVPSQAQRQAALAGVPAAFRNPAGLAVFNLLPGANVGADLRTSNSYVSAPVIRDTGHLFSAKLDEITGSRDQFSFVYVLADDNRFNPFDPLLPATNLPGYGSYAWNRGHNAGLKWTHALATGVMETRVGFNRHLGEWTQQHSGEAAGRGLGFPDVITRPVDLGFPLVAIAGFDGIGEPRNLPQKRRDDTFTASEILTWRPAFGAGHHELKFGGQFQRFRNSGYLDVLARGQWSFLGSFTGNPLKDLLLGMPSFALGVSGDTNAILSTTGAALYAQDQWRINDNLALTLGLRWEMATPPIEKQDRLSIPDLSTASVTCSPRPDCQFLRVGGARSRATYKTDYNDLGPRVGISWRPLRRSQLVLRSAYGIYYSVGMMGPDFFPRVNPPLFTTRLYYNFGGSNIQSIMSQPAFPQPAIGVMVAPDYRDGYVQQWRTELQQGGPRASLSVAYVGSKGTALLTQRNMNQALPGGAVPYPQFGPLELVSSSASSTYHALQTQTRLQRKGLLVQTAYTFSRSIDDASAFFGTDGEAGIPQNSFAPQAERGLSNFHAKHRLASSFAYTLPAATGALRPYTRNWRIGGVLVMQSGRPFTVNRGIDQSHSGTATLGYYADRPNQIADPFIAGPVMANPDPACHLTIAQGGRAADAVKRPGSWFNPCAFAGAGLAFGNTGRNSLIGPDLRGIDLSLDRTIFIGERSRLQCRIEVFNATNRPNFDLPDRSFDSGTFAHLVSANRNGLKPPRQIQLSLEYLF